VAKLRFRLYLSLALVAFPAGDGLLFAQSAAQRQPPASSRRLQGRDGDVVAIKNDDRLTIVRRREGNVRLVFDPSRRSLMLLADYAGSNGEAAPDGLVDVVSLFTELSGEWPLGVRWDGAAVIDEYSTVEGGRRALVISATPAGAIQLGSPVTADYLRIDPTPDLVFTYRGSSVRPGPKLPFDEAERRANDPGFQGTASFGVTGEVRPAPGIFVSPDPAPTAAAPLRVGGDVRQPTKLFDVKPVYPPQARAAGVTGSVIVEITVGTDGAVTDARVLRGIPLLDNAALQAVRQWRYDVTMLNGVPVSIKMIVTVPFRM